MPIPRGIKLLAKRPAVVQARTQAGAFYSSIWIQWTELENMRATRFPNQFDKVYTLCDKVFSQ